MIHDGIYRIYKVRYDEMGETHRRLAMRLLISNGEIKHLEDHHGGDELLPEGPVTPLLERRFLQLQHSGYHEVIHEGDIAAGQHESEVEPLDVGPAEPEHRFIMTGDGVAHPAHVEMWDDVVTVDGRQLDDTEAHQLLSEVAAGRLVLTPLD
jgi:hypothetical protein